jgi:hypothetical protein
MYGATLKQNRFACGAHSILFLMGGLGRAAAQAYFLYDGRPRRLPAASGFVS